MKTLLIAAAALSVLGGTVASAQPYGRDQDRAYDRSSQYDRSGQYDRSNRGSDRSGSYDRSDRRYDNRGDQGRYNRDRGVRHYSRGERLPRNYWSQQYVVSDWRARHLRQPPRGYQWRRVNNDYVLAAVATGLIASIIAGR